MCRLLRVCSSSDTLQSVTRATVESNCVTRANWQVMVATTRASTLGSHCHCTHFLPSLFFLFRCCLVAQEVVCAYRGVISVREPFTEPQVRLYESAMDLVAAHSLASLKDYQSILALMKPHFDDALLCVGALVIQHVYHTVLFHYHALRCPLYVCVSLRAGSYV